MVIFNRAFGTYGVLNFGIRPNMIRINKVIVAKQPVGTVLIILKLAGKNAAAANYALLGFHPNRNGVFAVWLQ